MKVKEKEKEIEGKGCFERRIQISLNLDEFDKLFAELNTLLINYDKVADTWAKYQILRQLYNKLGKLPS